MSGQAHITPTPGPIVPELLTTRQAAELLGIGERTLWRYANCGYAPVPVKIGGAVRFRRGELLAWIEAGCPDLREGGR